MKKRQFVDHVRVFARAETVVMELYTFDEKNMFQRVDLMVETVVMADMLLLKQSMIQTISLIYFNSRMIAKSGGHGQGT